MSYAVNPYNFQASVYVKSNHQFVTALGTLIPLVSAPVSQVPQALPVLPAQPPLVITPEALTTFSFPVQQVQKLIQELTQGGAQSEGLSLTQKQLDEAILLKQSLPSTQAKEDDLRLLQVLAYYFNELSDIEQGAGKAKTLTAKRLRELAFLDGDPEFFTFEAVVKLLGRTPPLPTALEIARRLEQSELMIQRLATGGLPRLETPVQAEPYHSDAAVETTDVSAQSKNATMQEPNHNNDAMALLQAFHYDVKALIAAMKEKGESVDSESLRQLLKWSFESIYQLENQLQRSDISAKQREQLKLELAGTQRLYNLATVLKQHDD
jgi:hypothetical protein